MSKPRTLFAAAVLAALPAMAAADPIKFMRDPHINHDKIVFSYQGDIWIANADGTSPRRLTAHRAHDIDPRFSPDGQWIAFSSDRMGNYDVYVVPVDGGEPEQLTFFTGNDNVQYWTPDGQGIVITTSRGAAQWGSPLYVVPRNGGIATPLPMDFGRAGMIRQDGQMVAFNRNGFSETRKGYRGNNSTDIWVQDLRTHEIRQLTDPDLMESRGHVQDALPMWGADGKIYFVSERSGIYNIWRIDAAGGAPEPVTRHTRGGVKYPSISPDGSTIIYTQEHELYAVELPAGQPRKITVDINADLAANLVEYLSNTNRADGFTPSPDGEQVAVDFHGEIFIVPTNAELGEKKQVTRSAWRDRNQQFSPDGKYLAYISDESGDEEIWLYDVATGERRKLTAHPSSKSDYVWSPDSRKIAFEAANRLFEIDVASGRSTELGYNEAGGYSISEYSADGRWLVYSRSDESQNSDVYLFEIASRRETDVTPNPARDSNGRLTPDGSQLVFTSSRATGNHLYTVPLRRLTEDPNDPLVRARSTTQSEGGRGGQAGRGGQGGRGGQAGDQAQEAQGQAAPAEPLNLTIELDGIDKRARALTSGENGPGSFFLSRDGRTVYFTSQDDEGPGLFSVGIDGRDRRKVTAGSFGGLTVTPDKRNVFYRQGGGRGGRGGRGGGGATAGSGPQIYHMAISSPQRKDPVTFDFTVVIDARAEWQQIFGEAWRVMRDRFYDEDMHGKDWRAIRAEYEPLVRHVGTYEDLYSLANQMIGELNASHVGVSGPGSIDMPSGYRSAYLGFEMEPADGRYKITHIYRDGPADQEWLDLEIGDYVLSIDGQELRAGDNYWKTLNHTLNDYVPIDVASNAAGQDRHTLRIQTVGSISNLKYEEWVANNREFVDKETNNQIAYVHIRAMNQASLDRFEEEINQFWDKKGIIVDVRFNGGGNTDQALIDILERRPYEFWNSRWGARTWGRRPRQAIAGPKVMLINHRSGSDAEVTPKGFSDLGLGRLVGQPTAAAVIATGSYGLINGGSIRTPGSLVVTWDPTKPNNYGVNLEHYGVAPDVWVENSPEDELNGFDRELKAAIDEAMRMLREGVWQHITTDSQGSGGSGGGS